MISALFVATLLAAAPKADANAPAATAAETAELAKAKEAKGKLRALGERKSL